MMELLDGLDSQGITQALAALARADPAQHLDGRARRRGRHRRAGRHDAVHHLRRARPARPGQNPNWADRSATRARPAHRRRCRRRSSRSSPPATSRRSRPTSCIVGSGAGGGVIAGDARQGRAARSCVVEAAGYFNESDFNQLELPAYQEMYWRGGPQPTADMQRHRSRPAPTLGGGTVDQLDQLPAHPPVGARAVGARARPRGRRRRRTTTATSTRCFERIGGERPAAQRPERPAPADEGGRGRARLDVRRRSCATPTRRATTSESRRPTWASATSPAPSSRHAEDLAAATPSTRRRRSSCACARRARAGRERPRRRRRGGLHGRPGDRALARA